MSYVLITDVEIVEPIAKFTDYFPVDITFECLHPLKDDLEWKFTYVGSAESDEYDQELESVLVGPVPIGRNKFRLEVPAPDFTQIPDKDKLGVTVILITCSYIGQEFFRVGYYVNNDYDSEELRENPPAVPPIDHIVRNILFGKPRVTLFQIDWDKNPEEQPAEAMDIA